MSATEDPTRGHSGPGDESGRVFHLLGRLWLEPPDDALLEEVATWATRWRAADPPAEIDAALEPLAAVDPEDATRLNEAFTRLVRGVLPGSPDPPYESLYRDGALEGPSGAAVRSAYRSAGVDLAPDSGELADHLGIECHFVGTLRERGDAAEAEAFLAEHPRQWVGEFAASVRERDPPPFYRGLLTLTEIALSGEVPA